MAKDIKILFDNFLQTFDFNLVNGDLDTDEGLETAVLISLFSDKRAAIDDPLLDPLNPDDKRGWWGDLLEPVEEGDEIGSKLWLLAREKTTNDVYNKLESYINDALDWMIKDGVITKVDLIMERQIPLPENNILAFEIKIYKIDGRELALNYSYQWDAIS
jgi:phage gp46-like protein